MTEKELLALEWLYRMVCHSAHIEHAMVIQDILIDRGVDVCVQHRTPLREEWPKPYRARRSRMSR